MPWAKKWSIIVLLLYLVTIVMYPQASVVFEFRQEIMSGMFSVIGQAAIVHDQ